jgi:HKD family nuclease
MRAANSSALIFPHFADGGGYVSSLLLTNATDRGTTATLSFFSGAGAPLDITIDGVTSRTRDVEVPAHGSAKVTTSGLPVSSVAGWVKVTTAPSVELSGNAVFQFFKDTVLFSEASVPAVLPVRSIDFFADEEGSFKTGFALANPGISKASGTITLWRQDGAVYDSFPISLDPGGHMATFVGQIFGDHAPSGRVQLNLTTGCLAAVALRFHTSSIYSTVTVGQPGFTAAGVDAMFSPDAGIQERLVAEIDKAQSSIDIAIYSFTANSIREALVAAKERGITIRIISDTSQEGNDGGEIPTLKSMGFNLKLTSGLSNGIMHNKYMIIDGMSLVTGSYNWSSSAEFYNHENVVFLQGTRLIEKYQADFDKIWTK